MDADPGRRGLRGDLCVAGDWLAGQGERFASIDPGTGDTLFEVRAASSAQVESAVAAAAEALADWSDRPTGARIEILNRYAAKLGDAADELTEQLARETGKPLWEARTEVDLMIAKVPTSIEMLGVRRSEQTVDLPGATAATRYRPIGVLAVLGPFNLPGHLPNGHIVPALLAGNSVVFKPSEATPGVGARMVELLHAAGVPPAVVNLVQGGRAVGEALVLSKGVDGVLFTGSYAGGQSIAKALADRPEILLALEMGGNNPLVVERVDDIEAAVLHTVLSAYITAGQRCTCARRLIVARGDWGDRFVRSLAEAIRTIRAGLQFDEPQAFIGPLISEAAAERMMEAESALVDAGGRPIVSLQRNDRSRALLHPGLIDVGDIPERDDHELFGPLLQVIRVEDFDAALAEANRTAFGLSAALFSDDRERFERFVREVRAGVVNWNRQTTGASGKLPFGGVGRSGNHRPAGAWAADYCSDPVATLEADRITAPSSLPPGILRSAE